MIKSSFKKLPGSRISLEVMMTGDDVKPHWEHAYSRAASKVELKGFRPGMAPDRLVEAALNKEALLEEALQDTVRHTLHDITEEEHWTVIDSPKIEITSGEKLLEPHGALAYKAELTVFPEIKLGDYKGIAKKIAAEKKEATVAPEEVEKSFAWLRKSRAPEIRVAREAKKGDAVAITYTVALGGKPITANEAPAHDQFTLGEGKFIPGFEEQIAGRKEGEKLTFSLTAPDAYWNKDVQGKKLDFSVTVDGVFEVPLPEANDEFAKSLGNFATLADLKKNIADGLRMEKEEKEAEKRRAKMLETISAKTNLDLPEVFVEKTLDGMIEELGPTLQASGKKPEDVRGSLRKAAEARVAGNLVVHEIAKLEHLEPTKEEVEEESKHHQHEARNLEIGRLYDYIYGILLNKKVFQFLENVK
ncbi:MAG: trigger factor [Candidatus Harrisonbacteria bacterium]|nr:trigger factor [Candidatus Harrisonbacteria bacterium]